MVLRKATAGAEQSILAREWNEIADLVNGRGFEEPPTLSPINLDFPLVKNTLGRDLDKFAAVVLGDWTDAPSGKDEQAFPLINPSLAGLASSGQGLRRIGILAEPIASNKHGRAQIGGYAIARIKNELPSYSSSFTPKKFASISDRDDMLRFASAGPIRVLQANRSYGSSSTSSLWPVYLGHEVSLQRVEYTGTVATWDSTPNGSAVVWSWVAGDNYSVGAAPNGGGGNPNGGSGAIQLNRPGHYEIIVSCNATPSSITWTAGDRLEWWINFRDNLFSQTWNGERWGSVSYDAWNGVADWSNQSVRFGAEHTFWWRILPGETLSPVVIPGVRARRVTSAGSASSVTLTGGIAVKVIYHGPADVGSYVLQSEFNTILARGASAGPI